MGEIIVLRLMHVLGGIIWVGSMTYMTFFLMPAMAEAGPAGGAVMGALQKRNIFVWLPIIALLTLLSGLRLLMLASGGFSGAYFRSTTGCVFLISGILAILAFVIGFVVSRPAMARSVALAASMATADDATRASIAAEIGALRARGAKAAKVLTVMLLLAAVGMSVARYL